MTVKEASSVQKTSARNVKERRSPKRRRFWRYTYLVEPSTCWEEVTITSLICFQSSNECLLDYREGDRVTLEGEADQVPDQEPGDIVFHLVETEHPVFRRAGPDLTADLQITLAEALAGFSRVVLKHLDGRGIELTHPKKPGDILSPGQVLKIAGEGMPFKKSDARGDLYLIVDVIFPDNAWAPSPAVLEKLKEILPKSDQPPIEAETVDEVDYESDADMDNFGQGDARGGAGWEDDNEEGEEAQCATQ